MTTTPFITDLLQGKKSISISPVGKRAFEVVNVSANVNQSVYTTTLKDYGTLTIQNTSKYVSAEISVGGTFLNSDFNFTNMLILKPGQSIKINTEVTTIKYRARAGIVNLTFIFGGSTELTAINYDLLVQDIKSFQYRIVGVDRYRDVIYAYNEPNILASTNNGVTWTTIYTVVPSEHFKSGFVTFNGTLLFATPTKLFRLVNNGSNYTCTEVLNNFVGWRGSDGISQSRNGVIMFGEKPDNYELDNIRIWKSIDDGITWSVTFSKTKEEIRHWHNCQIDPYDGSWVILSGDINSQIKWYKSIDDGLNWIDLNVPQTQMYRTIGLIFDQNHYIWATDAPDAYINGNAIWKAPKNNLAEKEILSLLPCTGFCPVMFQNDTWFIGSRTELQSTTTHLIQLYMSKDRGKTWQVVFETIGDVAEPLNSLPTQTHGFSYCCQPSRKGELYFSVYGIIHYTLRITP